MRTKSGKRIINFKTVSGSDYPFRGQVVVLETPKMRVKNLMWDKEGRSFYKMGNSLDLDIESLDK